jgi:hypothetical protein
MARFCKAAPARPEVFRRAIQLRSRERTGAGQTSRHQPHHRTEVAQAHDHGGCQEGPTNPRSTVLSAQEKAIIVAFRRHTLLPLDDCFYGLQPSMPHLTRSTLHRCLECLGISRSPEPTATSLHSRDSGKRCD